MPSIRLQRLQKLVLQDVSIILTTGLRDPRLKFGSVTSVKLSDDMRHAKIMVSCLGSDADRRTFMRGLESAKGKIQSIVAKHLATRVTPRLEFAYDEGVERSIRISAIIEKALDEDDESRKARGESPAERGVAEKAASKPKKKKAKADSSDEEETEKPASSEEE